MFGSADFFVNQILRFRLTAARTLSRAIAATLFPPRCCLCGFKGASYDLDLCCFCRAELPWLGEETAGRIIAMRYEHPIDEMIRQLKYQHVIAHARVLGVLLAQAVSNRAQPLPKLLVPVPLHIARLRERGFNQAAAIARYAGRMLELPLARNAARRVRHTPSQTSLDMAQRQRNVRGAFEIRGERQRRRLLDAGHVAIVDDVMTTGSTASELRAVLLEAGVGQVDVWAVARVSQARPTFFNASSGGPSNFVSGTLPV